LGSTNLADMSNEIRLTAERTVADNRPLFDRREVFRPREDDVRAEETRLREAVMGLQANAAADCPA
jgi:hypothetical protein